MKQAGGWLWRLSLANLLFLYGPIAVLILFSFNASRLSATWQGWSLQWYRALWANQALLDACGKQPVGGDGLDAARAAAWCRPRVGMEGLASATASAKSNRRC